MIIYESIGIRTQEDALKLVGLLEIPRREVLLLSKWSPTKSLHRRIVFDAAQEERNQIMKKLRRMTNTAANNNAILREEVNVEVDRVIFSDHHNALLRVSSGDPAMVAESRGRVHIAQFM